MNRFLSAVKILIVLFFISTISESLYASDGSGFSYDKNPIQLSVRFGYRYPTGNVSSLGGGVDFRQTEAKNIFKPGPAYGLNLGYVIYPLIVSYNMEGGSLPYTSRGNSYAKTKYPSWSSVRSEFVTFEGLAGFYFLNNGISSLYAGLSFGTTDFRFTGSSTTSHYYYESAAVAGAQIRPIPSSRSVFFLMNIRYQLYIEQKVLPHDVTMSAGIGYNTGF